MKKTVIIIFSIIAFLLAILLTIPFFFKGDIVQLIEREAAANMEAELNIGDMSLSMFRSFPDLNVELKDVTISRTEKSASDTLAYFPQIEASVNLKSLMGGEKIVVNRVLVRDGHLLAKVDTAGHANWDIFPEMDDDKRSDSQPAKEKQEKGEGKGIELNNISIGDLFISYNDFHSSTYASVDRADLQLAGNFSEANTLAQLSVALQGISFRQQNQVWVNHTDVVWRTEIASDLKTKTFEVKKNDLRINDLQLNLTGKVTIEDERYRVDLHLNAPGTKFESLLSLLPQHLLSEAEGLETTGDFKLDITAQGDYYKGYLPKLDAQLVVNDASVKYPQLPEAIRKINFDLRVTNPGDIVDSTRFELRRASLDIAGNPFNLFLNIANPKEPVLDGKAFGIIDFANLKKTLPLKDITLEGVVTTDMAFKGMYKYIEQEEYEKFMANGEVAFQDIRLVNQTFPQGISIPRGSMTITPAYLKLNKLQGKIYSSDFALQGKISNYLPYLFRDELLKGDFTLTSNLLNINEFILDRLKKTSQDTTQTRPIAPRGTVTNGPSAAEGVLEVPRNIDIQLSTDIQTLVFDRLTVRNVKGKVDLANATATLKNLRMNLLKGSMVMNGQYSTVNPQKPNVDFNLGISDFDIHEAYNAFTFIRKSIPVAINCEGQVSASLTFAAMLDRTMSPVMNTANGQGYVESKGILIHDNPAMNQLATVLKNNELSRLSISHLKINFKLEDGNIVVEPFKTTFAGNPVTVYGKQSVEGDLDYTLSMRVNRRFFGNDINQLLKSIPGSNNIQELDLDAHIGGTLAKPTIKPDLSKAIKAITKEAEKSLKGNILQGLQSLFKKK